MKKQECDRIPYFYKEWRGLVCLGKKHKNKFVSLSRKG